MASPPTSSSSLQHIASVTPKPTSRAWQTAVHPRLPMLATCDSSKAVQIYSLSNFVKLSSITGGHKRSIRTVSWKPNVSDESVLATGSFDASVGIWRRDDNYGQPSDSGGGGGGGGGGSGDAGSDSAELDFTGGSEHEEDEEWRFALVLDGHESEVKSVAWSSGGNLLATCARDKSVWIWEEVGEEDYETIAVLQEHTADVKTVAWHPEEELLASGSYDDDIRLWREDVDDWDCVAVLRGHESTVWMLGWEPLRVCLNFDAPTATGSAAAAAAAGSDLATQRQRWIERREAAGPRLASCSDDGSIRIWRRIPRERREQNTMSIIRSGSIEEDWVEEARLPQAHLLSIYAVAWSPQTGRIASTGADGRVVVYEERWTDPTQPAEPGSATTANNQTSDAIAITATTASAAATENHDAEAVAVAAAAAAATAQADRLTGATAPSQSPAAVSGAETTTEAETTTAVAQRLLDGLTSWHVVAEREAAHGVHEVNHVAWSRRADRARRFEGEEMLVSTGDDGSVSAWAVPV